MHIDHVMMLGEGQNVTAIFDNFWKKFHLLKIQLLIINFNLPDPKTWISI